MCIFHRRWLKQFIHQHLPQHKYTFSLPDHLSTVVFNFGFEEKGRISLVVTSLEGRLSFLANTDLQLETKDLLYRYYRRKFQIHIWRSWLIRQLYNYTRSSTYNLLAKKKIIWVPCLKRFRGINVSPITNRREQGLIFTPWNGARPEM